MPRKRPVFRPNERGEPKVHVLSDKCASCIFHPGNRMRLNNGTVREMVDACKAQGTIIPCHEVMDTATPAVCGGFYQAYADSIPLLQMAERMGVIEMQDPLRPDEWMKG